MRYEILCVVFQVPDIWDGADLRSLPTAAVYGGAVRLSSCISNQPRGLYDPVLRSPAGRILLWSCDRPVFQSPRGFIPNLPCLLPWGQTANFRTVPAHCPSFWAYHLQIAKLVLSDSAVTQCRCICTYAFNDCSAFHVQMFRGEPLPRLEVPTEHVCMEVTDI